MKKITLLALCAISVVTAQAAQVDEAEAHSIAQSFLNGNVPSLKSTVSRNEVRLAHTVKSPVGVNDMYVFNVDNNRGYVIVAADDAAYPVLGYADEGQFNFDLMPEHVKNWFQGYADEIEYARANNLKAEPKADMEYASPVAPLLGKINWGQESPFNDLCPVYDITKRCPSGCVATAMAQVMYYHQWPAVGKGSHSYKPAIMNGGTLTANFGETHYDWSNMLPVYDSSSTEVSNHAVAELMLHCGVSVDMVYYESSGADAEPIAPALYNYFDYDQSVAFRTRTYYSTEEWQSIIINELNNKRPIVALGMASSGGHCFVFDGYDTNGLVHVNWGWNGMSNGYFRTSALNPSVQGTGGADGGFNNRQYLITGIRKPFEGSEPDLEFASSGTLKPSVRSVKVGEPFNINWRGYMNNTGWKNVTFDFGVMLKDSADNVVEVLNTNSNSECYVGYEVETPNFTDVSFSNLTDGKYRIYAAARIHGGKGEWHPIRDRYVGYPNYINVTVANGMMTFSNADYFDLAANIVELPNHIYSNSYSRIVAHITNNGDVCYFGDVVTELVNKDTKRTVAKGSKYRIDLAPGDDIDLEMVSGFNSIEPGQYYLSILDDDGVRIADLIEVTVVAPDTETVLVEAPEGLSFENNNAVECNPFHFTTKLKCTQGMFSGSVNMLIMNESGAVQKAALDPVYAYIEEGETVEVTLTGYFENGVPGTTYTAGVVLNDGKYMYYVGGSRETTMFQFTLAGGTDAVDNIAVDNASDVPAEYYTIDGRKVANIDANARGLYIKKQGNSSIKVIK